MNGSGHAATGHFPSEIPIPAEMTDHRKGKERFTGKRPRDYPDEMNPRPGIRNEATMSGAGHRLLPLLHVWISKRMPRFSMKK
jgi:hypothetical protein